MDRYGSTARTLVMIQMSCPALWNYMSDYTILNRVEKMFKFSEAREVIEEFYGLKIRRAVEALLNEGSLELGCYEANVQAANLTHAAINEYGVEYTPWAIAECRHLPKMVASSEIVSITRGFEEYSSVITIRNSEGEHRIGVLNRHVDRRIRILFYPNRMVSVIKDLSKVASLCRATRATLIKDSNGREFIAVDDPDVNINSIHRMFSLPAQRPWIEVVMCSKKWTKRRHTSEQKEGYYRVYKRVVKKALEGFIENGRSFTSIKKAVRGVKICGKELENAEVIERMIQYLKPYNRKE